MDRQTAFFIGSRWIAEKAKQSNAQIKIEPNSVIVWWASLSGVPFLLWQARKSDGLILEWTMKGDTMKLSKIGNPYIVKSDTLYTFHPVLGWTTKKVQFQQVGINPKLFLNLDETGILFGASYE